MSDDMASTIGAPLARRGHNPDLEKDKRLLIEQIEETQDAELVWRLRQLISDHDEACADGEHDAANRRALSWHLEGGVEDHVQPEVTSGFTAFQVQWAGVFFWVSVGSLLVLGLILMLLIEPYRFEAPEWLRESLGWAWVGFMGVMGLEMGALGWIQWRESREGQAKVGVGFWLTRLLVVVLPPFRMALRLSSQRELLWLPKLNWVRVNQALFEKLSNDFAPAMIVVSLMIVPLLLVELRYEDTLLDAAPWLPLFFLIQTLQALIWVAFTFEFLVMSSVHEDRTEYIQMHWIDALIIMFPLLSFFRLARVVQLARGYRLRVLLTRIRQAAILVRLLQRLALFTPTKQLARLRRKLRRNHQERQEIEHMILMLLERIRQRAKATTANAVNMKDAKDQERTR